MQQSKRPLSTSEDLRRYCCMTDSPMNSPRKYMCIPNNTPQVSPERYGMEHAGENMLVDTSVSTVDTPNFVSKEFQNELLQALFNKFPDTIKMESYTSQWLSVSRNIPSIPPSDSEISEYVGDSDAQLTVENLESYNLMYMSNSLQRMELDRNNSFSDQMSTMATCASDISDHDSLSEFEEDEVLKRVQSVSLDTAENHKKLKQSALRTEFEMLKYQKKASSLDNLHDLANPFIDFETTL